jgi:hypothetical protein
MPKKRVGQIGKKRKLKGLRTMKSAGQSGFETGQLVSKKCNDGSHLLGKWSFSGGEKS